MSQVLATHLNAHLHFSLPARLFDWALVWKRRCMLYAARISRVRLGLRGKDKLGYPVTIACGDMGSQPESSGTMATEAAVLFGL